MNFTDGVQLPPLGYKLSDTASKENADKTVEYYMNHVNFYYDKERGLTGF